MTPEQMRRAAGVLEDLEYFDLARLLREQADAMGWRPIETAPRDGTQILLLNNNEPCIGNYWYDAWRNSEGHIFDPGGWAEIPPMPPPPEGGK